jgi:hypothetical protein
LRRPGGIGRPKTGREPNPDRRRFDFNLFFEAVLTRYFFDTADGDRDTDSQGVEFDTDDAAREAAIRFAGSMVQDRPSLVSAGHAFCVKARDAGNRPVITVTIQVS